MARLIEWGGAPFALLIEATEEHGAYLVPPIVLDEHGRAIEGRDVLEAIVNSGVSVQLPVIRNATPAMLAEVDRNMQHISESLGVPIGPPDVEP
jgi:hypothetical protein